jgi:putative hemolysin
MSLPLTEILVIVVLTLLEAVFVSAEIALVSIRRSRVEQMVEENVGGAARVRRMLDEPGRFLAVVQIGVTFVGFLAAAYAAVSLTTRLGDLLRTVPAIRDSADGIALVIVTLVLALFTIVFGELVPKSIALAHRERFALALAGPVDILGRVLTPIVALLTGATGLITRSLGVHTQREASISTEELMLIVERGGEQGVLEAEEEQMIHAVIELGDRRVHEVMVPRIAIVGLPVETTIDAAIDTIVGEGHSRIPIYEETVDEVVGILYAKDLLPFLKDGAKPRPNLRTLLRTPVFVPESMSIDDLLHELQRRKVHLAIVLDEYGGTAGLVTIEHLLEEIVGEIQDEYDVEEPLVERLSDDEARVDGRASIDDLAETFDADLELDDSDEYDTVGGLIFHRIGGVPKAGDQVHVNGLLLTVESTDGRRVGKVLAVRERQPEEGQPAEAETDR